MEACCASDAAAGLTCTLQQGSGGEELVAREIGGAMSVANVPSSETPRTFVAWRRLTRVNDELECRIERGATKVETSIQLIDVIGAYSLASSGASASLSSVIVLTAPGPKNP